MGTRNPINLRASEIATLGKPDVIECLLHFKGRFALDFNTDYLNKLSTDKLRHILFAAIITNQKPKRKS